MHPSSFLLVANGKALEPPQQKLSEFGVTKETTVTIVPLKTLDALGGIIMNEVQPPKAVSSPGHLLASRIAQSVSLTHASLSPEYVKVEKLCEESRKSVPKPDPTQFKSEQLTLPEPLNGTNADEVRFAEEKAAVAPVHNRLTTESIAALESKNARDAEYFEYAKKLLTEVEGILQNRRNSAGEQVLVNYAKRFIVDPTNKFGACHPLDAILAKRGVDKLNKELDVLDTLLKKFEGARDPEGRIKWLKDNIELCKEIIQQCLKILEMYDNLLGGFGEDRVANDSFVGFNSLNTTSQEMYNQFLALTNSEIQSLEKERDTLTQNRTDIKKTGDTFIAKKQQEIATQQTGKVEDEAKSKVIRALITALVEYDQKVCRRVLEREAIMASCSEAIETAKKNLEQADTAIQSRLDLITDKAINKMALGGAIEKLRQGTSLHLSSLNKAVLENGRKEEHITKLTEFGKRHWQRVLVPSFLQLSEIKRKSHAAMVAFKNRASELEQRFYSDDASDVDKLQIELDDQNKRYEDERNIWLSYSFQMEHMNNSFCKTYAVLRMTVDKKEVPELDVKGDYQNIPPEDVKVIKCTQELLPPIDLSIEVAGEMLSHPSSEFEAAYALRKQREKEAMKRNLEAKLRALEHDDLLALPPPK
eukprot:TRINITY_DN3932_c0_g1_i3.p1 TRINITY_DN3932_c0_g1~~TRINITY_DN3932_c0_g1_i3.p1  ORF type:complete len:646 (+),score=169.23 TRINITY_DN3932_c0_g1_i3:674-2611(+)